MANRIRVFVGNWNKIKVIGHFPTLFDIPMPTMHDGINSKAIN